MRTEGQMLSVPCAINSNKKEGPAPMSIFFKLLLTN